VEAKSLDKGGTQLGVIARLIAEVSCYLLRQELNFGLDGNYYQIFVKCLNSKTVLQALSIIFFIYASKVSNFMKKSLLFINKHETPAILF
jgi:hypothetical protein